MREIFIEYIPDLFFLLVLTCRRLSLIQFSLDIRRGYIPVKFRTENTKTNNLGLNRLKIVFYHCYLQFSPESWSANRQNREYQDRQ